MTRIVESEKDAGAGREASEEMDDKTIWEVIDEIMRGVPEEALRRLPANGAEQHDHYLYGSPKRAPQEREERMMSENLEAVLNAARRLPVKQQRQLVERLLKDTKVAERDSVETKVGSVSRHFGSWDSGDVRSADNSRIDEDLAREFSGTPEA